MARGANPCQMTSERFRDASAAAQVVTGSVKNVALFPFGTCVQRYNGTGTQL